MIKVIQNQPETLIECSFDENTSIIDRLAEVEEMFKKTDFLAFHAKRVEVYCSCPYVSQVIMRTIRYIAKEYYYSDTKNKLIKL